MVAAWGIYHPPVSLKGKRERSRRRKEREEKEGKVGICFVGREKMGCLMDGLSTEKTSRKEEGIPHFHSFSLIDDPKQLHLRKSSSYVCFLSKTYTSQLSLKSCPPHLTQMRNCSLSNVYFKDTRRWIDGAHSINQSSPMKSGGPHPSDWVI